MLSCAKYITKNESKYWKLGKEKRRRGGVSKGRERIY